MSYLSGHLSFAARRLLGSSDVPASALGWQLGFEQKRHPHIADNSDMNEISKNNLFITV
jgi:hypothetical protein